MTLDVLLNTPDESSLIGPKHDLVLQEDYHVLQVASMVLDLVPEVRSVRNRESAVAHAGCVISCVP
jgi:hypothetical protein